MARSLIVLFLGYYLLLSIVYSECSWTVPRGTGYGASVTLDLSCVQTKGQLHINGEDDSVHDYYWTVCDNGESCNNDKVMVKQTVNQKGSDCYVLGRYETNIMPIYSNDGDTDSWTFHYANGQNDCGSEEKTRTWVPTLLCSPETEWQANKVQEAENSCIYSLQIETKYACSNNVMHCIVTDDTTGLSWGWMFVMGVVVVILIYCVIGYLITGFCINKEGGITDWRYNIPQKSFWMNLPSLVLAGCVHSKNYLCEACSKNDSKEEHLIDE